MYHRFTRAEAENILRNSEGASPRIEIRAAEATPVRAIC
jgi:hypothetical protein